MQQENHEDDKIQTCVPLSKGMIVAHNRIIEKIGAGGMVVVYPAENSQRDREVVCEIGVLAATPRILACVSGMISLLVWQWLSAMLLKS